MGYTWSGMRLVGGPLGQQLFLYRTTDSKENVKERGYFKKAIKDYALTSGDILHVVCGRTGQEKLMTVVVRIKGDVVTIAEGNSDE